MLVAQQAFSAAPSTRVRSCSTMSTVLLQILSQSDERRTQAGPVGCKDASWQLYEHSGHPCHPVVCGLQSDWSNFEGRVRKTHELRKEGVGAAEMLVAAMRGRMMVVVMRGWVGRRAGRIVVSIQVVQRKVLSVGASTQSEMVVMVEVNGSACVGVVFVGQSSRSPPLAHHHATKLACPDLGQGYGTAPSGRGQVNQLRLLGL